jgi:hypothetical protein
MYYTRRAAVVSRIGKKPEKFPREQEFHPDISLYNA